MEVTKMTSIKQKLSVLLVLSLFLLSVIPAGLADEGKNVAEVAVDSDAADAEVKTESKTEVETEDNDSEVKEKTEIKTEMKEGRLKSAKLVKREVKELKRDLHKAREKLEEAKEHFREAKEEQHEQREKVLDLDKKVKECKSERKNCEELKLELRTGVKNHLLKSVQVVQRSLDKLSKTVEKMEDLSDEEKDAALSLVSDLQAQLEAQKTKIEGFTNETTQEEIRATIKDLKELNQKANKLQRRLVGLMVNAKLHVLVEKHEELHAGMQARIDALAAKGVDVSELEAILADFDAKTETLKQDYEAAKQQWINSKDTANFDQFNRALRDAQHQVREDLQETKHLLRQFVAKYHELAKDLQENETEENETAEESEQENNASVEINASAEATAYVTQDENTTNFIVAAAC